jgi:hypothetical protein
MQSTDNTLDSSSSDDEKELAAAADEEENKPSAHAEKAAEEQNEQRHLTRDDSAKEHNNNNNNNNNNEHAQAPAGAADDRNTVLQNDYDGLRRRKSVTVHQPLEVQPQVDLKEEEEIDEDDDDSLDPNQKNKRPIQERPIIINDHNKLIVRMIRTIWVYIAFVLSFALDVVVFFSPSTKSRHRARGHSPKATKMYNNHNNNYNNDVMSEMNPKNLNDAEFNDFVRESQHLIDEMGIQQLQRKAKQREPNSNNNTSLSEKLNVLTKEELEIRLLKARLAQLEKI